MSRPSALKGIFALSPMIVLLVTYLGGAIATGDFYCLPISLAFGVATLYAFLSSWHMPLLERLRAFVKGAGDRRILYMICIFILAGVFGAVAEKTGAVDSTVKLTLNVIPANYLPAGIFLAACFISMSIGTSVGTVVALTPVAVSLSASLECDVAWMVAIVVGGAFFGDNLSFISDTTIVATQTQGCSMRSKFLTNILLVLPAAIVTLLIYAFSGNGLEDYVTHSVSLKEGLKCIPYVAVIVMALLGMNVLLLLSIGIVVALVEGFVYGAFGLPEAAMAAGEGVLSMWDLILVTLLAGGMLEIVRRNGGIGYIVQLTTSRLNSRRGAEFAITSLTALANVCTANNTIAILTAGDVSRDISKRFSISPRRSASLMDTTSCFVQGILPYGAQLLMAAGMAGISPLEIVPNLYYPMLVGVVLAVSIITGKGFRTKGADNRA